MYLELGRRLPNNVQDITFFLEFWGTSQELDKTSSTSTTFIEFGIKIIGMGSMKMF
jgi:hypothetical protein